MSLADHLTRVVEKLREPLGLDRWQIRVSTEAIEESRAYCLASPEYREADLCFDLDKLKTGDDIDELACHEMAHCHTWEIHQIAEELANALAESAPDSMRDGLRKMLLERVRRAGEATTTDVGHTYLRLARRAGVLDTPAPTA